ncbi:hypothetical protein FD754_007739 [Muntiacus muntjak]|uniref:Uncharacterized protein n=1 Tax=Muntiacus muntjak TaxID=9888 RepID=A0A5N3WQ69_MUNMU|nr:hypothetical protein FD754_007739 [Muntiacus muntjak]
MDPVVLCYMDSRLWQLDISLLDSASWLKVHVIGLAFEYLANTFWFICEIKMAFFIDSYGNSNSFHAKQVAEKLETFLGRKGNWPLQQPESLLQLLIPTYITKKREEWKDLIARLDKN